MAALALVLLGCICGLQAATIKITHTPNFYIWPYTGYQNSSPVDVEAAVVVRIPRSMIEQYGNATIYSVNVGWDSMNKTGKARGFVRTAVDGPDLAVSAEKELPKLTYENGDKLTSLSFGNSELTVSSVLGDADNLYIGYYTMMPKGEFSIPTDVNQSNVAEGMQWLGRLNDGADPYQAGNYDYADVSGGGACPIIISLTLRTTEDTYNDMAVITHTFTPACSIIDEAVTGLFHVKNTGMNDVTKLELTYTCGSKSKSISFSTSITPGQTSRVAVPVVALGAGTHTVDITKVNGKDNKSKSPVSLELLGVSKTAAAKYTRRPLIEYFVSEAEYTVPGNYEIFKTGYYGYQDKMTLICRHMGDQFMVDNGQTEYDEDTQLALDFCDGNKMAVSVPSMMVDRSWNASVHTGLVGNGYALMPTPMPEFATPIYDAQIKVPTFADLTVNDTYTEPGKPFEITVQGNVEPDVLGDRDLNVSLWLCENDVESTGQMFRDDTERDAYDGVYSHEHLIRLQLTPMYGDALTIAADGTFTATYECELDEDGEWNADNLELIAALTRPMAGVNDSPVVNSLAIGLKEASNSVETVEGDLCRPVVTDGAVTVPGATGVEVYTLDGARVRNAALLPGIYVVRASAAGRPVTGKVCIK